MSRSSKSSTNRSPSRRTFIKNSATAASVFFIVPSSVVAPGHVRPSDKLNLAAIGAGGKGHSDILHAANNGQNQVVALCDVDSSMANRTRKEFPKAAYYYDFRQMLEDLGTDIDAVTISTPDHTHAVAAMAAMQLGKHVYVQKPLTHNIKEARQLTLAARQYRCVTQMGNQGASRPEQEIMQQWYDDRLIGDVHTVHVWTNRPVWPQGIATPTEYPKRPAYLSKENWDVFIGPAQMVDYHPLYHPFKWRGWWNFGTGALGDMGCHLIDSPFRILQLGYPTEVECSVGQVFTRDWIPEYIPESCPPSSSVQLKFPDPKTKGKSITMNWSDGGIRPFHPDLIPADDDIGEPGSGNGVMMIGDKGIMTCGTYGTQPKVYLNDGGVLEMPGDFHSSNPYQDLPESGHQVAWTEACKAGYDSAEHKALTSSFDYSGPLTETVLMGNLAIRSYIEGKMINERREFDGRRKLLWDGDNMKIINYDPANRFVGREYRKGWE